MSSGPKKVKSTTETEPPEFLRGPLGTAANAAEAGFTGSATGQALTPQSQDLLQRTLTGQFLTPDSNPFLEQTFNRAADLTRTRLGTEFAGAGRDVAASLPARSEELQTLAANLFGSNFQRERDRQITAIDQARGLDPLNLFIDRLAGIIPGAGGVTTSVQPTFKTGLF